MPSLFDRIAGFFTTAKPSSLVTDVELNDDLSAGDRNELLGLLEKQIQTEAVIQSIANIRALPFNAKPNALRTALNPIMSGNDRSTANTLIQSRFSPVLKRIDPPSPRTPAPNSSTPGQSVRVAPVSVRSDRPSLSPRDNAIEAMEKQHVSYIKVCSMLPTTAEKDKMEVALFRTECVINNLKALPASANTAAIKRAFTPVLNAEDAISGQRTACDRIIKNIEASTSANPSVPLPKNRM